MQIRPITVPISSGTKFRHYWMTGSLLHLAKCRCEVCRSLAEKAKRLKQGRRRAKVARWES